MLSFLKTYWFTTDRHYLCIKSTPLLSEKCFVSLNSLTASHIARFCSHFWSCTDKYFSYFKLPTRTSEEWLLTLKRWSPTLQIWSFLASFGSKFRLCSTFPVWSSLSVSCGDQNRAERVKCLLCCSQLAKNTNLCSFNRRKLTYLMLLRWTVMWDAACILYF